jgi:hypothetical protein
MQHAAIMRPASSLHVAGTFNDGDHNAKDATYVRPAYISNRSSSGGSSSSTIQYEVRNEVHDKFMMNDMITITNCV